MYKIMVTFLFIALSAIIAIQGTVIVPFVVIVLGLPYLLISSLLLPSSWSKLLYLESQLLQLFLI